MKYLALAFVALFAGAAACADHPNIGHATGGGGTTTGGKNLLPAGTRCTFNAACASGVCGPSGTGNCCSQACATADPTCGAIACDGTGACSYPNNAITCPASCTGSTLSQTSCNGEGACALASSAPCPDNFACGGDGGLCDTTCTSSAECATGFVCNAGACVSPIGVGPCTENDDCTSARCGISGVGHCCSTACVSGTAPCGATDCGADSGACVYPNPGTLCGPDQSCAGGLLTSSEHCDGAGTCIPGTASVDCAPYTCGTNACLRSCNEDGGCAPAGSCDLFHNVCCAPGLKAGGSIAVDPVTGNENAACCGLEGHRPCQTITHAMQVIDRDQQRDVTIVATVDGGWGTWPPGSFETYPIVLGWGAELSAPGVTFGVPNNLNTIIFTIERVSSKDNVGYASMVGGPGDDGSPEAELHMAELHMYGATNLTHIQVQFGSTLYLANAAIEGFWPGDATEGAGSDIDVAYGGTLVVGADRSGAVVGPVWLGDARIGLECEGSPPGEVGCAVSDVPLHGISTLLVGGVMPVGISAGDNTTISLKAAPVIGLPVQNTGGDTNDLDSGLQFLGCGNFNLGVSVGQAVVLAGKASMTFENGTVRCILDQGFYLVASPQGVPSLNVSNSTILNTGLGIYASAGTATISSSSIVYNGGGVEQDTDGTNIATIDLSGGAAGGINVVACSSNIEGPAGATGVSVLNTTSKPLNASNVAWDTSEPDVFACHANLGNCTCEIASCADAPGANGMDAVYESTGTITTTGNKLSNLDCSKHPFELDTCDPTLMTTFPWLTWLTCCPISDGGGVYEVVCPGSG